MENQNRPLEHCSNPADPGRTYPNNNCDRFILTALCCKRPKSILQLGLGSGNLLLSIAASQKEIQACRLDCVQIWQDKDTLTSDFSDDIQSAGINLVTPISEIEFINDCDSDNYDFLILNSVHSIGALWVDELLRITRSNGFLFIKNANHAYGSSRLPLIQKRFNEAGIFCYRFTEPEQCDGVFSGDWLFSVNGSQKNLEDDVLKSCQCSDQDQKLNLPSQKVNPTNAEIPGESKLFLGLSSEGNYGWGVCSKHLIRELGKLTPCEVLDTSHLNDKIQNLDGKLFQTLTGIDLFSLCGDIKGTENYGYTFFEDELTPLSSENAKKYDLVLAGSTWCRDRLRERGIQNCDILLQGIDPNMFFPLPEEKKRDGFVIFSGGKFELRKGQDLVLRAVKILQQKYPDIFLVNCWYNNWPQLVKTMAASKYIQFDYQAGTWLDLLNRIYDLNGLDANRIKTFELVPYQMLREIYGRTDLGIFPNRCEGGTNLVLMEYMACAKPVVVANTSGHKDVVNADNALLLNELNEFNRFDSDNKLIARWQEPSLEELVAQIEYAYHHRDALSKIANKAGQDLKKFTWEKTARQLIRQIWMC